jgi:hypothetical protein
MVILSFSALPIFPFFHRFIIPLFLLAFAVHSLLFALYFLFPQKREVLADVKQDEPTEILPGGS